MSLRLRTLGTGLVDQVLSSGSNIVALLAAARVSDVLTFGQLALAMSGLTAVLAISRGLLGTPVTLKVGNPDLSREIGRAMTGALVLGTLAAVVGIPTGLALSSQSPALILMACTPAVLFQDIARYAAFSSGQAGLAVGADGLWFAMSLVSFGLSLCVPITAATVFVLWGSAALVGALYISMRMGVAPAFSPLHPWRNDWGPHRSRLGYEASIGAVASLVQTSAITILMGATATAALRGAGTVVGPLSLVFNSLPLVVVPELRRGGYLTPADAWRKLQPLAWLMSLTAASVGILSIVAPPAVGAILLGPTWAVAQPVVWVMAVEYIGHSWLSIGSTALRANGRTKELLIGRSLLSGAGLASAVVTAWATRAVVPVAVSSCLVALLTAGVVTTMCRSGRGTRAEHVTV